MRASKIRRAEYHFKKAMDIHPNNAVVLGCVAMVSLTKLLLGNGLTFRDVQTMERTGQSTEALRYYNKAIEVSPENALVRYRRAKMMMELKKYEVSVCSIT